MLTTVVRLADHDFTMSVADTPAKWKTGLGEVDQLAASQGMVFLFPGSEERTFWMKGVEYPIDIVWVNDSQVLGWVTATPGDLTLYPSPGVVDMVLELPAGTAKDIGLTVGDTVILNGTLDGY
ncbi:MAG: DUF192 domain-containing protein [Candidatus Kerfeldbacteria bacterium]|nr:DUF192 domain-containing protein [Candidatus Kerfeldbacteria bacterium]